IHIIPSPGLFRVECMSCEIDQWQSHFGIFTVGIMLSSSEPTRLPGGYCASTLLCQSGGPRRPPCWADRALPSVSCRQAFRVGLLARSRPAIAPDRGRSWSLVAATGSESDGSDGRSRPCLHHQPAAHSRRPLSQYSHRTDASGGVPQAVGNPIEAPALFTCRRT